MFQNAMTNHRNEVNDDISHTIFSALFVIMLPSINSSFQKDDYLVPIRFDKNIGKSMEFTAITSNVGFQNL